MAFGQQQIFPIDFNKSAAVGIDIPFNGPAVFISNYQTKNAIKNNLINFFLTDPGERFLNPSFGGGFRKFLFEQITENNIDSLKEDVSSQINIYFPNVVVSSLEVLTNEDQNKITTILTYGVANTNISDTITIEFE